MKRYEGITYEILERQRGTLDINTLKENVLPLYLIGYCAVSGNKSVNLESILNSSNVKEEVRGTLKKLAEEIEELREALKILEDIDIQSEVISKIIVALKSELSTPEQYRGAFECMLEKVSDQMGKAMEIDSTPKSINQIATEIVEPKIGNFFDGTFGLGGDAIEAYKFAEQYGNKIDIYGQELNMKTYAIACIRLYINGIRNSNIKLGNMLVEPAFPEMKFRSIIMNPPFGMSWKDIEREIEEDRYSRFIYGLPGKSSSGWLFVSSVLKALDENGKAAITTTMGALFRSGAEENLRKKIIGFDYIEAIIELTGGLFNNTGIPCAIIIFNMNKSPEMKNKIKFINASEIFESVRRGKKILNSENVEEILSIYRNNEEVEEVSKIVDIEDIESGNLLPSKYVVKTEFISANYGKVKIDLDKLKCTKTLGEIGNIYRGINVTSKNIQDPKGKYKIINLADIKDGELDVESLPTYSIENNARVEFYKVEAGDVVISNKGATKICVIPEHEGEVLISQNFIGIRVKSNYNPYYIKEFLESPIGEYLIDSKKTGTAVTMINPKDLKEIPLVDMGIEEQEKIINDYNEEEKELKRKIQELQEKIDNMKMSLYDKMNIKDTFKLL